ncbi:hypothetical protein [Psychroflexus sp. ALD_RP9]|uniref:hypothetical protein n=1 Tax=Psychroflexus sp. ALD_RP9 TaxID=2777186 RepID=UPI001A8C9D4A|nr:hypothetical protein [Psychroflexus sp. ALD_RP9]QSS96854.1 hypothetical protein IMZ30_10440 [Psychroflexus sp. ALD_RP9]
MKKIILLVTLSLSLLSFAQEDDKIESLKIAFFTEELQLTPDEAKLFWPVYNKHTSIYYNLRDKQWSSIKKRLDKIKTLSESEANQLLDDYINYKIQRNKIRVNYVNALKKVISPKQIMMLKKAEYDFNKKLIKQYSSKSSTKD